MEKKNSILPEDLQSIQDAKANAAYMRVLAEKAYAEQRQAELQAQNTLLMAFIKYGLSNNDQIDPQGKIVWGEDPDSTSNTETEEKVA